MLKSKLKVLLALNDMNQKQLADLTGIRPQTLSNIMNNKIKQIPVDAVNSICMKLKCNIQDIFEYIPDEADQHEAEE